MKTLQSDLQGTLERFRADMADWKTDMARRDKDNQRWTVGFGIAQIAITIAVLGAGFAFWHWSEYQQNKLLLPSPAGGATDPTWVYVYLR